MNGCGGSIEWITVRSVAQASVASACSEAMPRQRADMDVERR
jgi:hypothetical protein